LTTIEWQTIPKGQVEVCAIMEAGGRVIRRPREEKGTRSHQLLETGDLETLEVVDRVTLKM